MNRLTQGAPVVWAVSFTLISTLEEIFRERTRNMVRQRDTIAPEQDDVIECILKSRNEWAEAELAPGEGLRHRLARGPRSNLSSSMTSRRVRFRSGTPRTKIRLRPETAGPKFVICSDLKG